MMNRILCLIFCAAITNIAWAQDLEVATGASFFVSPASSVYVTNNINVVGDLIVTSDAAKSGSLIVKGTATGDLTYERYIANINWHLVTPPVGAQSIPAFVGAAGNDIAVNAGNDNYAVAYYKNDNLDGQKWTYHNTTAAVSESNKETLINFENGVGYSTRRATTAGNYTFTGTMTPGDVSKTIGGNGYFWTCLGNPYTSFVSASALYAANSGSMDTSYSAIYLWSGAAYVPYNASTPDFQLQPGQAFMVKSATASETFAFTAASQQLQTASSGVFQRTEAIPSVVVNLSNGTNTSRTVLKYFENTTTGLDVGWDAGTFNGTSSSFAIDTHLVSDSEGVNFTLQCLPDANYETSVVPLSVKAAADKTIIFSAEMTNLPENVKVYLEDKVAKTVTDITTDSHQVSLDTALNGIGRFYLHTSANGVLGIEDDALEAAINIYTTSKTNLRITSLQQGPATVKVFTILGKEVVSSDFQLETVNNIALPSHLATGVYVVQLGTDSAKETKKIIIE